jgi:hypothetical protein
MAATADPPWFDTIEPGHVLKFPGNVFRVVRAVSRHQRTHGAWKGHVMLYVHFAIRHGSWTGRCHTVMNGSDLETRGATWVPGVKIRLNKPIDQKILAAINQPAREYPYILTANDVRGLP